MRRSRRMSTEGILRRQRIYAYDSGNIHATTSLDLAEVLRLRAASLREAATPLRMTALRLRHRRAPIETKQKGVPYIAQILDPNLAGEEAIGSHLPKKGKEIHPWKQLGILFSARAISYQVENYFLLLRGTFEKCHAVPVLALTIQPHHATAKSQLVFRILAGEQVNKFRRPGFHGPAALAVGWNDGLAKRLKRFVTFG